MSLVAQTAVGFSLFYLSEVVTGSFQPLLACCDLIRVVPLFTSHNVAECFDLQTTINQL